MYLPTSPHAQDCRAESRRWLGATRARKEATSSVRDLLHSCSRDLATGNKLNWLQTPGRRQPHAFPKNNSPKNKYTLHQWLYDAPMQSLIA